MRLRLTFFDRHPRVLSYLAAFALAALSTGAAEGLLQIDSEVRVSLVYLTGVLVTAFLFGAGPAYFAAALAFAGYNFYLSEHRFTLEFGTAGLLTLTVFFSVAMLTGNLTGRVRDEAERAKSRANTTAALLDATRDFSESDDEVVIRRQLVNHLANAASGPAIVGSDGAWISQPADLAVPRGLAAAGVERRTTIIQGWHVRPLRIEEEKFGFAAWRLDPGANSRTDLHALLEILVDAGAAAIAKARLAAGVADAESWARTENLRNALLSSISHDLRTPLASIIASASSLREFGQEFDEATRDDLAATIQEEATRLNIFVSNLLNMSRLEAGVLTIQSSRFEILDVVTRAVERYGAGSKGRVAISCPDRGPRALGDPVLLEQALGNIIENALRYAPLDAAVRISCALSDGRATIEISDEGPGVTDVELPLLFVKFYRSSRVAKLSGTGLGLSIAKGLVEGMGGEISAANQPPPQTGLVVTIRLLEAS
jgi:K+-sensing histidine kinase KdpD